MPGTNKTNIEGLDKKVATKLFQIFWNLIYGALRI